MLYSRLRVSLKQRFIFHSFFRGSTYGDKKIFNFMRNRRATVGRRGGQIYKCLESSEKRPFSFILYGFHKRLPVRTSALCPFSAFPPGELFDKAAHSNEISTVFVFLDIESCCCNGYLFMDPAFSLCFSMPWLVAVRFAAVGLLLH